MLAYEITKWLHLLGATVLLGTGAGIAFFMLMAHRTRDPRLIQHVASTVVIADALFTATAVVAQPVTGTLLIRHLGLSFTEFWIWASIALYILTGLFWLPVVWMQIRLRDMAGAAAAANVSLPAAYYRLFGIWFACGFPAFFSVLAIVWLMLSKPTVSPF